MRADGDGEFRPKNWVVMTCFVMFAIAALIIGNLAMEVAGEAAITNVKLQSSLERLRNLERVVFQP